MIKVLSCIASLARGSRAGLAAGLCVTLLLLASFVADRLGVILPAGAADPPVIYMSQVGKELMSAARTRSPGVMATVIQRHADVSYIGLYSLGNYRAKLAATDRDTYFSGMVRFISRYAASEAPKYPVSRVNWTNQSTRGSSGVMVDSQVVMQDGTAYDVRWLLAKYGNGYKVRDAMVLGFWMTPFLKKLFEDYIEQNGGNLHALTAALNRS
ncbi:MAG TPA: ABC transporter substrate-binding protein [Hyphomicrobiaceae bacterium]|jgi:phospholipid transport system substrate-binding protein|nr:ABC transporter substrate-binding protein [Hyphomicrobiaceae bacterium]